MELVKQLIYLIIKCQLVNNPQFSTLIGPWRLVFTSELYKSAVSQLAFHRPIVTVRPH
jgi:hypothetical protein